MTTNTYSLYDKIYNDWSVEPSVMVSDRLGSMGASITISNQGLTMEEKPKSFKPKKKKNEKKKPYFKRKELKVVNGAGRGGVYPNIKKVIFNEPATVVLWKDGSKTVVRCRDREHFDRWTGLAMCFMKKIFGDEFHHVMKTYAGEEEK